MTCLCEISSPRRLDTRPPCRHGKSPGTEAEVSPSFIALASLVVAFAMLFNSIGDSLVLLMHSGSGFLITFLLWGFFATLVL
ncbi:uncharacterized protein EV422DRAFT_515686 [Fimicolochytrium jonesii]|uniref:uncharacterized protein n=1 Tax=Fimicolochytrium jonesii TaxID=1396493 RepID=UPI0022FEF8FC|nr:uncharacterized protein EV422DRAFT_515686 [Fimicolochytrium jonesii]KAI8826191.1 hypothetical protein EV422DRAFT_515686 [Fimicolochytrium jonesii]